MADFDFSELTRLAADLGEVPDNAGPLINSALQHTAVEVKRSWQKRVKGAKHLPGLPAAIDYDVAASRANGQSVLEIQVGFNKDKPQGALGNVNEFGTPLVVGRGHGQAALEENIPDFEKGLDAAIRDAERRAGL